MVKRIHVERKLDNVRKLKLTQIFSFYLSHNFLELN